MVLGRFQYYSMSFDPFLYVSGTKQDTSVSKPKRRKLGENRSLEQKLAEFCLQSIDWDAPLLQSIDSMNYQEVLQIKFPQSIDWTLQSVDWQVLQPECADHVPSVDRLDPPVDRLNGVSGGPVFNTSPVDRLGAFPVSVDRLRSCYPCVISSSSRSTGPSAQRQSIDWTCYSDNFLPSL
ncbi:unnamed protein product [Rhodiola kirilowii]